MSSQVHETYQFDRQKFIAAVHYICSRQAASNLGKVKLHKVLYFADMLHFLRDGRPLTGVDYIKQQFGPTARHLGWALRELVSRGKLLVTEREFFGFPKADFTVLEAPSEDALSQDEKGLLDEVSDFVCLRNAKEISELSHNAAWDSVDFGEVIPYYTAFALVPCEVTDSDVEWAEQEHQRLLAAN